TLPGHDQLQRGGDGLLSRRCPGQRRRGGVGVFRRQRHDDVRVAGHSGGRHHGQREHQRAAGRGGRRGGQPERRRAGEDPALRYRNGAGRDDLRGRGRRHQRGRHFHVHVHGAGQRLHRRGRAALGRHPGAFTGADGATVYTLVVTPPAGSAGSFTVGVPAGVAQDTAGNPNTAANPVSQPYDREAPTLAVADQTPDAIASGPVTFTFSFSEPVFGFDSTDVDVSGGTKGAFGGSPG